jgi:hypothetical protein
MSGGRGGREVFEHDNDGSNECIAHIMRTRGSPSVEIRSLGIMARSCNTTFQGHCCAVKLYTIDKIQLFITVRRIRRADVCDFNEPTFRGRAIMSRLLFGART